MKLLSTLSFSGYHLYVHLGWSEQEREMRQLVTVDVALKFETVPLACQTDDLKDTICYEVLTKLFEKAVAGTSFKLIENLAYKLFEQIKENVPPQAKAWIRVTKVSPPVPSLKGGASFSLGDWSYPG